MSSSTRYFRLNRNGALAARYSPFLLPSFHSGFLMTFFSPIICLFLRFRSLFFSFLLCLVWVALVQLVLVGSCWLELLLLVFSWNSRVDSLFTEEREKKKRGHREMSEKDETKSARRNLGLLERWLKMYTQIRCNESLSKTLASYLIAPTSSPILFSFARPSWPSFIDRRHQQQVS